MIIKLNEIPHEGREWRLTEKSREILPALKDVVGSHRFAIEVKIQPQGQGTFSLQGRVQGFSTQQCSRCADDFDFEIKLFPKEIMLPKHNQERIEKAARINHLSDLSEREDGVIEYSGNQFNLGAYIHGIMALEIPHNPCPPPLGSGECSLCHINVEKNPFSYEDKGFEDDRKPNPFAKLAGFQVKNKKDS